MELCLDCGSNQIVRDEVDIGVGTLYGPRRCFDCGWEEQECSFPDCGCAEARLCQWGANGAAMAVNLPKR